MSMFDPVLYYTHDEIDQKNRTLYQERLAWLKQFPELSEDITQSLLES